VVGGLADILGRPVLQRLALAQVNRMETLPGQRPGDHFDRRTTPTAGWRRRWRTRTCGSLLMRARS
jgi:hypothetical protein